MNTRLFFQSRIFVLVMCLAVWSQPTSCFSLADQSAASSSSQTQQDAQPAQPVGEGESGRGELPPSTAVVPDLPIVFDHYEVDVGEVEDDLMLTYAFTFTNMSSRPQKVELVNYCSSCSKPEITPSVVTEGQSGIVVVEIPTFGKSGDVRAAVTIGVAGYAERADLTLTAHVIPKVKIVPNRWSPDSVLFGEEAATTLQLVIRGKPPEGGARIEEIVSENPLIFVESGSPQAYNQNGRERTEILLNVKISSTAPLGKVIGAILVRTNMGSASVQVNAQVTGELKAEPAIIGLGRQMGGMDVSTTFEVTRRNGEFLTISEMMLSNPPEGDLSIHTRVIEMLDSYSLSSIKAVDGRKAIVHFKCKAPMNPGHYELRVRIKGRGKGEEVTVPIRFLIAE